MAKRTCKILGCAKSVYSYDWCIMHYKRWLRHGDPLKTLRAPQGSTIQERLEFTGWTEIVRHDHLGACWEWKGSKNVHGYGEIRLAPITRLVHRVAFEEWRNPIPEGMFLLHRCDNPPCINPEHLFIGDQLANMGDASRKDRTAHGERAPHAKLTFEDVKIIREIYSRGGITQTALARRYGVDPSNISRIVRGEYWRRAA